MNQMNSLEEEARRPELWAPGMGIACWMMLCKIHITEPLR